MTKKFTIKKLKIAQVPGDQIPFSPAIFGSPHSITAVSYLLTEELVKKGHKVTVFVPSDSKTSAKIAPNWIPSTDIRFKKYKFGSKERYNLFKNYCQNIINQADNFDIIHIHDLFLGAFKFLKALKTSVIGTFHNPKFYKKDKKYSKVMFVGISRKQIQNNPGFNFVGMVYNGIPLKKYPFNKKPKNYLLWIGRVSPEKGPLEAIKVAKKTKKKLIMLGPLPSHHKSYIKKVLSEVKKNKKNISFLGLVSFKKKINLLKNALVLLSPIKWEEPFGLVIVEAMACLPKGQEIFNSTRLTSVEKVKDEILFKPVFKKFERIVNEKIIEIKPEFIPKIALTKEHPVMVSIFRKQYSPEKKRAKRYNYVQKLIKLTWKKAKNLKIGDWLVFPKLKEENPNIRIPDDLLHFYGWYVAEGCIDSNNIQIDLGKKELAEAKKLAKIISKNFKKWPTLKETETTLRIRLTNSKLAKFLSSNFGSNGKVKRIPESILKLPKEKIKIFLDAYIKGDGHYEKRNVITNVITIATISKELAYQLILALSKLNILSNICIKRSAGEGQICGRTVNFKKCWKISFSPKNSKSKKRYLEDDKNFYIRVKNLKRRNYSGKVFNFNTLSNTFQAPFILVHNCGTPVIAFNRGSAPEIIRNNKTGFLVKNVNEMAKAIEKIPMISRKKCREHVEKNFTVQKMADGYEKVYRKIVKNKKIK